MPRSCPLVVAQTSVISVMWYGVILLPVFLSVIQTQTCSKAWGCMRSMSRTMTWWTWAKLTPEQGTLDCHTKRTNKSYQTHIFSHTSDKSGPSLIHDLPSSYHCINHLCHQSLGHIQVFRTKFNLHLVITL